MRIFNIDKALELPQTFNVLHNALDKLYVARQEEFQKNNPLKQIFKTVPLDRFSKTFGSSTGFKKAFEQTVDYAGYPGFTNGDGFKATVTYKPFNGKVVFSWQTILEADYAGITETLKDYQIAWQRQIVTTGMFVLTAFFTDKPITDNVSKTKFAITSADTRSGDPMDPVKNPVFYKNHTIVKSDEMSAQDVAAAYQSNKFYVDIKFDGSDPLAYAKLANALYQLKVYQNKLKDDNGQFAGLHGRKKIVCVEDAQINMALDSILAATDFSVATGMPSLNPVKNGFDTYYTPYLDGTPEQPIPQFAVDAATGYAAGLLILDPEYNNANKGPMMVERLGFSMKAVKTEEPEGVKYLAKQAFDFFCPSWRGCIYLRLGKPTKNGDGSWDDIQTYTEIKPVAYTKAVTVTGPVTTQAATTIAATGNAKVTEVPGSEKKA